MWPRPLARRSVAVALTAAVLALTGVAAPAFADEPPPEIALAPEAGADLSLSVVDGASPYLAELGPTAEPSPLVSTPPKRKNKGKHRRNARPVESRQAEVAPSASQPAPLG